MTKLSTYIGELLIRNLDRVSQDYCNTMNIKRGWIGAKRNNKGLYDVIYYKTFPKKSYKKHYYLRNLNEN